MFLRLTAAAGGLLVLFHAWLLASQLWDGQLAEPGLVLRWLVAAGLVTALAGLRRGGESMFRGRRAISIWLLAALLHGPAMAARHSQKDAPALPEVVSVVLQIAAASLSVGLGLALLLALSVRRPSLVTTGLSAGRRSAVYAFCTARVLPFAPRPPPALLSLSLL